MTSSPPPRRPPRSERPPAKPAGPPPEAPPQPVDAFHQENEAISHLVAVLRLLLQELDSLDPADSRWPDLAGRLAAGLDRLREVDCHYARKEALLLPCLERHGFLAEARRMWQMDDDIRREVDGLADAVRTAGGRGAELRRLRRSAAVVLEMVEAMILAEEQAMLPRCEARLSEVDWACVAREGRRLGRCLVETGGAEDLPVPAPPAGPAPPAAPPSPPSVEAGDDPVLHLATGRLSLSFLEAVLRAWPREVTLVDAEGRVAAWTDPPERLFCRSPAMLGRPLLHCHPPSVEAELRQLLSDLREGRRQRAWLAMVRGGIGLRLEFVAVHDREGRYAGCLEMVRPAPRPEPGPAAPPPD